MILKTAGSKPVTSSTFYVLLALADADRHGVGIGDEVRRRTEGMVELGPGTLYATLSKMIDRRLIVQTEDRPTEGDDPRRRYYRITEAGRDALAFESRRLSVILEAVRHKGVLGAEPE